MFKIQTDLRCHVREQKCFVAKLLTRFVITGRS
jgi:hypothetical protein